MDNWSAHHIFENTSKILDISKALQIQCYTNNLLCKRIPVIFSLAHLGKIIGIDYNFLHSTVNRKRESSNYNLFSIHKRSGGLRFIHAVNGQLFKVQKYINNEILRHIYPHPTSYAFHCSGGIRQCAERHCGCQWLFHFDLRDFFYTISEKQVFKIFKEIGYKPLLAFELARLCTTIRLPKDKNQYIKSIDENSFDYTDESFPYQPYHWLGVLPQGAPTSPMLSNLVAKKLDDDLFSYAQENGFIYTRYADDLIFSASILPENKSIGRINKEIITIIRKNGFHENPQKTHVAGPGAKKVVLGLLVDGPKPKLIKEIRYRIDKHFYLINKFDIKNAANHYQFDSVYGYVKHIAGLMSFVHDVDQDLWKKYFQDFQKIQKIYSVISLF